MRRSAIVMGVCLALAIACAAGGKIIYVDDDAPPGGDGKSWATSLSVFAGRPGRRQGRR